MKRHLTAAVLAGALALAPTAAFAQDGEAPEESTTSSWDMLGEVVRDLFTALVDGRTDGEPGTADSALVEQIEAAVTDLVAGIYFEAVADAATEEADEVEGANGEAVSTVAQCAPRGSFKGLIDGMAHHGEYVTAAAHGETVTLNVPGLAEGEDGPVLTGDAVAENFDLTTTEGAQDLCAALDVVYQVRLLELELAWEDVDTHKDARVLVREQCQLLRLREKNGAEDVDAKTACAELRQRTRDQHAQERADAKADRDEAREQAKAEREQARADRAAARAEARAARGRS